MKAAILLILCIATAAYAQVFARAILQPINDSGVHGYVLFSQTAPGANVTVTAVVNNITYGADTPHGIHVHWWGDLSGINTGGLSVGGHWNPTGAPHSCPGNDSRHFGDMGNWETTNGVINMTKSLNLLELTGNNSIIGRAVIFHNLTDDCNTANTGNAGGRMATGVIGIINSTVVGGAGEANQTDIVTVAGCMLQPASGTNVSGMVYLVQTGGVGNTMVYAMAEGYTGAHGFHLHWFGDVSNPNGTATGAHYNPTGKVHGVPPVATRHLGDMGIINGSYYIYSNDQISLNGANNVIGRAIHIHMNSDDCTNPVGNGGARWAQCVIGILNSTAFVAPTFPADTPTTQNGIAICAALNMSSSAASSMSTSTEMGSPAMQLTYAMACLLIALAALLF